MKGLQKVNGEMNLIMLVYNIKRTLSILGFTKMMEALQNWQPDYSRIVFSFIWPQLKMIGEPIVRLFFLTGKNLLAIKDIVNGRQIHQKTLFQY